MLEGNLLPIYRIGIGEIKDGYLFKTNSFCFKRCDSTKCQEHYQKIFNNPIGPYQCPYGFTTYIFTCGTTKEIFTSFKLKHFYDPKKTKGKVEENTYSPILTQEQLNDIIENYRNIDKMRRDTIESSIFIKDRLHEIRGFNAKILTVSEDLVSRLSEKVKKNKDKRSLSQVRNINALSSLTASRFTAYDATVNPESLKIGTRIPINIHNKFYKCKMCCIDEAEKKNIKIKFIGSSTKEIDAFNTLELLPFLLIDNAIKYSPLGKEILVKFEENDKKIIVTIESYGPYIGRDELYRIFEKDFRSQSVKQTGIAGSGIGLFLAQTICDLHNIYILADFAEVADFKIDSISYGLFKLELQFPLA